MQEDVTGKPQRAAWAKAALFGAVIVATIAPRLSTVKLVFSHGELMQWDGDSAYHLKRILHALARFPDLPRFDPAMNWPAGAACPWPDGFDLLAAAWGLVVGLGDVQRATIAVLLFTPMLALVAAWAAMDLARLVVPDGPAKESAVAAAGLLTAVAPGVVYQSQLGFLDHHVAELIAALVLSGWALRRIDAAGSRGERRTPSPPPEERVGVRGRIAWELGGSLATIFAVWTFAGGVLYLALACAIVLVAILRDERPGLLGSGAPGIAAAAIAAAALAVPAVRAHGRVLSYQFPSLLQPLLVAAAAAGLALGVAATRLARRPRARAAVLAALVLAIGALAAAAFPPAVREIRAGLAGWLLRRDPWIATIDEFQPLGGREGRPLLALWQNFGAIGFAAPLALVAGGWVIVRAAGARGVAFVALTAGFVLFTVNQIRFGRIGAPLLMISAAAGFAAFAQRRRLRSIPLAVRAFPVLAAAVLVLSDPILRPRITRPLVPLPPHATAALDLRSQAMGDRSAGVLTPWDFGHIVHVLSGLPTPTNGFGAYLDPAAFAESEAVFRGAQADLDAFLERRRLRFVLAGAMIAPLVNVNGRSPFAASESPGRAVLDLEYMKSFGLSPLVIGGSAIPGSGVRHLERLMPTFASRPTAPGLAFALPAMWTYERVAGARVAGATAPGARVVASIDLRENGRLHVWRAFADAGRDGRFELVLPVPTGFARPTLSTGGRYVLRVGDGPASEVEVPEAAVRGGAAVRAGTVRAPPAAAGLARSDGVAPPG
jgi:hypothetical protein